jgi:hypothetical protein
VVTVVESTSRYNSIVDVIMTRKSLETPGTDHCHHIPANTTILTIIDLYRKCNTIKISKNILLSICKESRTET